MEAIRGSVSEIGSAKVRSTRTLNDASNSKVPRTAGAKEGRHTRGHCESCGCQCGDDHCVHLPCLKAVKSLRSRGPPIIGRSSSFAEPAERRYYQDALRKFLACSAQPRNSGLALRDFAFFFFFRCFAPACSENRNGAVKCLRNTKGSAND